MIPLEYRFLVAAALIAAAPAQELRKALQDADLVAVARQVGKREANTDLTLHRLQVLQDVRGLPAGVTAVTVLDWPNLSLHNRPVPRQSRLYCLVDAAGPAARLGLPTEGGPYYKMVGWVGSNPLVGADADADPVLRFARALAAAEAGTDPAKTAGAIADLALGDAPAVRTEATQLLAERSDLRARLSPLHWSRFLSRTAAETTDVEYKIALAELCAEQRLEGIVEALIVGLGQVHGVAYARAVGRLAAHLQGEGAAAPLLERLRTCSSVEERAALLLSLGATRTENALTALLQLKQTAGKDAAVEAALKEHRSRRAREALREGADVGRERK
jgi:hypothetical protein